MTNQTKPIRATLNIKSARKYSDGLIGAQVILLDEKKNRTYFACRASRVPNKTEVDTTNIWMYTNGGWKRGAKPNDAELALITSSMDSLITRCSHLFNRELCGSTSSHKQYGMWDDTVISLCEPKMMQGHVIKIGARIFTAGSWDALTKTRDESVIKYRLIGDTQHEVKYLSLKEDSDILRRLKKQFEYACKQYANKRARQPVGFRGWEDSNQYKYSVGQLPQSPAQYRQSQRHANAS
ncbi:MULTISPECIES: hypothetical protein [unclassified Psychrobacter]|uniref:hypothetical protein n=1 Tax=unclassified Psychrobacter TaxID=196806 RepID=UPI0018F601CA|nr:MULTISPECIES: hypothetical protein [unclassified Psychrobacter]